MSENVPRTVTTIGGGYEALMRVRRNFLNWGTFLIGLGAVPLAVQLGVFDHGAASQLLRLWPLILIAIGLGLLLRFTHLDAIGGVLAAGTFGVLLGSVIAGGISGAASGCNAAAGANSEPPTQQSGQFSEGTASLNLELSCADLEITRRAGQTWGVEVSATGVPTIETGATSLNLRSPRGGVFNPFGSDRHERWQVVMPTEQTLSANLTLNAATADMALGDGALSHVSATFNASDARLDLLGEATQSASLDATLNASSVTLQLPLAQTTGGLTLNAASLDMCVPEGAGIRIEYEGTLSSDNFAAAGLVQSGKTWQSNNYEKTGVRISLGITANVSSITLNPTGGCR
jgi:hypothetical protein